jgi:hypothetical protein
VYLLCTTILRKNLLLLLLAQDINRVKKIQNEMLASAMVDPKAKQVCFHLLPI